MNYTDDLISKARAAASAEELIAMAKEEGFELSAEDAEKYYTFLNSGSEELSDTALDAVAGGKGSKTPDPKYHAGQRIRFLKSTNCFVEAKILSGEYSKKQGAWYYITKLDEGPTWDLPLELPVFRTVVIG